MKDFGPDLDEPQGGTYQHQANTFNELRDKLRPGFAVAGPRFASEPETLKRGTLETIGASLSQGLTADLFGGFSIDKNSVINPEYDVIPDMRPGDERFAATFLLMPNQEETHRFQSFIDQRDEAMGIMAQRPFTSFFSQLLDPASLAIDITTYGLGTAVTLPLLANAARKTKVGIDTAKALSKLPRAERVAREAFLAGSAGAESIYIQESLKAANNPLESEEDIGEKVFYGSLITMALGGAVGLLGKSKTQKITDDFINMSKVNQNTPTPDFMGPPRPTNEQLGLLSTGEKPKIMAQLEEPKKTRTKEETKAQADQLKLSVDEGLIERKSAYANLRTYLKQLGEDFASDKNAPLIIRKAASLITAPIRNMSATNRMLSSAFGSARLFATSMTRNATEFAGTRMGFVLPRNAQNRVEDIMNHALDTTLDIYKAFMDANKVNPGAFAHERLALGKKIYDEQQFFNDVSTQLLHVGRPTEHTRGANEYVKKAAKHAYENFYKPYGEMLKKYKLLDDKATVEDTINYLNRHWKSSQLLKDPEGFKNWLADFFKEQNEALKSIMPNYKAAKKFANELKAQANRFAKAAQKIEKLKEKLSKTNAVKKIEELQNKADADIEEIKDSFNKKRTELDEKYARLKENPPESLPDITATKRALKSEIDEIVKERDGLIADINKQKQQLTKEISQARSNLKSLKQTVKNGSKDNLIKEEVIKADVEQLLNDPRYHEYTVEEIKDFAKEAAQDLDDATIEALRQDFINTERLAVIELVDTNKAKLKALTQDRDELLKINTQELKAELSEGVKLIEEEAAIKGKTPKEKRINRLLGVRRNIENKLLNLQEKTRIFKKKLSAQKEIKKLSEPVSELDFLQRKYSREGLKAFAQRKQVERLGNKELTKQARKAERERLKEITAQDEAQVLSDEFMEGYNAELEKAEAMIPEDLRSSSTGRPYRVFDDELEPLYAYSQAEKTFYTMIGQEDEVVMNPVFAAVGGGKPSMFKPRSLKMKDDYPGIEEWVERDIRALMNQYASGIAPAIALTEVMEQLNKLPIVKATVKRMQVLDKRIGAEKALDLPDEMQHYTEIPKVFATMMREEFRLQSEGLTGDKLQKLVNDYQTAEKNLATIDKQVKGLFANGFNVNSKNAADFVDLFNAGVSTVTTTNIVISMMSDIMAPSLRYGFKDYIDKSLQPLLASAELRALHSKELKGLGVALRTANGAIIKNRITGREGSLKNSALGKFFSNLSNRLGNITGANGMQDAMETATTVLVKSNLLEMAEAVVKKTATDRQITHLAQRGISKQQAKKIYKLWRRYGFEKEGTRGIDVSLIDNMSPQNAKAYFDYQGFINDELKTIYARPGAGSMPDISYTPFGKAIMYLKKYFFAATNDVLIPAAQRGDKEAVQGFAGLFAMGALQSEARRLYRGEERKEFNLEGFIAEALTNSAIPGVYTFGIDAGITAGLVAGMGGARYDPSNGLASLIAGPGVIGYSDRTLGILGKMRKIMTDEDKQFTYKDFNAIANTYVPLYKWAPISAILKPNIKQHFEEAGRGD